MFTGKFMRKIPKCIIQGLLHMAIHQLFKAHIPYNIYIHINIFLHIVKLQAHEYTCLMMCKLR